jgi:cytochrome P450
MDCAYAYHCDLDFRQYLLEFIDNSKNAGDDSHTLLNMLVKASAGENGEQALTEEELMGNAFVFLVAG